MYMEYRKMKHYGKSQRGFTLVELSIVLVIIGLIVSSVLVGQDLVRAAELRAVATQYQGFNAAVGTFKAKHNNTLPGDVAGAASFGYTGDGDGDGVLTDGTFTSHANADVRDVHGDELVFFWSHLGSTGAGLIGGAFDGADVDDTDGELNLHVPATRSGESWGVFSAAGQNYFILGTAVSAATSNYTTVPILSPTDAQSIDDKIDDGRPERGIIFARDGHDTEPNTAAEAGSAAGDCVDAAGVAGVYNTADTDARDVIACTLRFAIKL